MKKKRIIYRDIKGRIISKEKLSRELSQIGLTLSDYENGRKALNNFGSKSPVKDLYKSFGNISEIREIEEDYQKTIKSINSIPKNKGRAFLNGKRISKQKLAIELADFPRNFKNPFYFFYINNSFNALTIKVNLDEELISLVNNASLGDRVEDRHGNIVQISS